MTLCDKKMGKIAKGIGKAITILGVTACIGGAGFGLLVSCSPYWPCFPPKPNPEKEVIDAFPASELERMSQQVEGKKLALALITTYDYNGMSKYEEEYLEYEFAQMPGYKLFCKRVSSKGELFNALRDYSIIKPIDALILSFHGDRSFFALGLLDYVSMANASAFNSYAPLFSDDAVVLLSSCDTGKGEDNVARRLSKVLDVDVVAPKGELTNACGLELDECGRVSFDYGSLVWFKKVRLGCDEGKVYRDIIAPDYFCDCKDAVVDEAQSGQNAFLFVDK